MHSFIRAAALAATLCGCAGLTFNPGPQPGALNYYDSVPYLFLTVDKTCVAAATVILLPGAQRSVTFKSGYGTADLSVTLNSTGLIQSVGQKTDTKIPETITAIAGLAKAATGFSAAAVGSPPTAPACDKPPHLRRILPDGSLGPDLPLG